MTSHTTARERSPPTTNNGDHHDRYHQVQDQGLS